MIHWWLRVIARRDASATCAISAFVRFGTKITLLRCLPAPRTACTLRIPWRGRAASRRSCRSKNASMRGSFAASAGRRSGSDISGYCREGDGGSTCGRSGRCGGGRAEVDGYGMGGAYRSSMSSSSALTEGTVGGGGSDGGGEGSLDVVMR
jgi:hypothetical protein